MRRRCELITAVVLLATVCLERSDLNAQPVNSQDLRIRGAGRAVHDDFRVADGAVVDDATVILVGSTDGPEDAHERDLNANGWIVDLTKKSPRRRFTNGQTAPLVSVAVGHGMVATTSTTLDPVLRVSDLKSGKAVAEVSLAEPDRFGNATRSFHARWLHRSARLAVLVDKHIQLLDPKAPTDRTHYRLGNVVDGLLFADLAVAPDDARIACAARFQPPGSEERLDGVLVWTVGRENPVAVSTVPTKAERPADWRTGGITIGARGDIVAKRGDSQIEVPKGTAEKDVPAGRRGVVRIDPVGKSCVPTGMGTTYHTIRCAFDPTGRWLAVVGSAHADGPAPKDDTFASELRVYEFATARLVHREQVFARMALSWVAFSPSGKRLCAATGNGTLHWWDVDGL